MLVRNTTFNLVGYGAPLLVAIVTIPALVGALGPERFGLLTLIWAVVSYFGLFDLGLGRALTQQLVVALERDHAQVAPMVWTATGVLALLGLGAGALLALLAPWGVGLIQAVPDPAEATAAVHALALSMPFIVLTSGFRGILEARHAFGLVNAIRLPMGLFTFLGPLAVVAWIGPRLDLVAWTLSAGRVVACLAHAMCAWRELPHLRGGATFRANLVRPLCISGGWLTVSNVISPFMGYVDRFVIGATVSATAVAYYATPHEVVTKLWIVPGALAAALFPTFAARHLRTLDETRALFDRAVRWLFAALLPVTVALALFANELLALWLGAEFAERSAPLLRVFAAGMLVNALAHVPFTLIQGAGAARVTALIHAVELPFFLVALWAFTAHWGVAGAAAAWLLRVVADTIALFAASGPLLERRPAHLLSARVAALGLLAACGFGGALLAPAYARVAWAVGVAALCMPVALRPRLRAWRAGRAA